MVDRLRRAAGDLQRGPAGALYLLRRAEVVRAAGEPAAGRIVVVRAGVADAVRGHLVRREIRVRDGELQHDHPREIVTLAQRLYLGSDDAEILGHDGQLAEFAPYRLEDAVAGAGNPGAVPGRLRPGRYRPVGLEAAEVVDAHHVGEGGCRPQTLHPPAVARSSVLLPVIERVAPQLAVGAEVIGRDAGDGFRPARSICRMSRFAQASALSSAM